MTSEITSPHPPVTIIEGPICAGKTTFGRNQVLACGEAGTSAVFIDEPEHKEKFHAFCRDKKANALDFQMEMLKCRVKVLEMVPEHLNAGRRVYLDRSLYGDRVFEHVNFLAGNISAEDHAKYLAFFEECRKKCEELVPDVKIRVLSVTEEDVCKRFITRAQVVEVNSYTRDYLEEIRRTYENYDELIENNAFLSANPLGNYRTDMNAEISKWSVGRIPSPTINPPNGSTVEQHLEFRYMDNGRASVEEVFIRPGAKVKVYKLIFA